MSSTSSTTNLPMVQLVGVEPTTRITATDPAEPCWSLLFRRGQHGDGRGEPLAFLLSMADGATLMDALMAPIAIPPVQPPPANPPAGS
jgi:hypothetical protein